MDNADIEEEMEPYMDLLLNIAEVMIATKKHLENEKPPCENMEVNEIN